MRLSKKVSGISESLTLAISAKANKMKADGIDVIGFGAGQPDFDTPEYIKDAAKEALDQGYTNYTPASGSLEFKKAIIQKFKEDNGLEFEPDQIIVSDGAKHSLFNTFQAILNPGDEVIIPVPYWVSYPEIIKMGGGKPVYIKTEEKNGFKLKTEELKAVINDNTKALILNSPSNPTGCVYNKKEIEEIAETAVSNDLLVISDEIYEHLLYDDRKHISIASLGEDIKNLTVVINGMSKAFAMTGWRIGFAAGNKDIIKVMSNLQSHSTSNPNSIAQYASTRALQNKEAACKAISTMVEEFSQRRDFMNEKINSIDNLSCILPGGAFYLLMNISKLKGKRYQGNEINGSLSFADNLLEAENVAVVPGIAFGADNYVRLSYANSQTNISRGLERIQAFVDKLE